MPTQKINKLLIGTNNKGKLREIKSLLPKNIKIHSTSEFNLKSPLENGKTFKENSLIKSKYFSKKTGLICLACLLYTSPSPRDFEASRMPSSA